MRMRTLSVFSARVSKRQSPRRIKVMPRIIAILLVILGLLGAFFAFNMSITAPGTYIANLSLMAERQNILLVAAVFVLAGTILFAADHVPAERR